MVDDSEDDFLIARATLARAGFEVSALRVDRPDDLQGALEAQAWDLCLLDWVLPEMTTPEVLRILQGSQQPSLPCIVWSGRPDPKVERIALEVLGASGFLAKGQMDQLLAELVRSALASPPGGA